MAKDVIMPVLGMNQDTAVLLSWLKQEGERVQEGEPIMEVETDKATMELDAPATGTLAQVTARAGTEVRVGSVIAVILADGEPTGAAAGGRAPAPAPARDAGAGQRPGSDRRTGTRPPTGGAPERSGKAAGAGGSERVGLGASGSGAGTAEPVPTAAAGGRAQASPKARRLATERGIELASLRGAGSGPEGAILAADVLRAAARRARPAPAAVTTATPPSAWPTFHREIDAGPLLEAVATARTGRPGGNDANPIDVGDLLARFLGAVWTRHPLPSGEAGAGPARLRYRQVAEGRVRDVRIDGVDRLGVSAIASALDAASPGGAACEGIDATGDACELSLLDLSRARADLSGDAGASPGALVSVVAGRLAERPTPVEGASELRTTLTLRLAFDPGRVELATAAAWSDRVIELVEDPAALALLY